MATPDPDAERVLADALPVHLGSAAGRSTILVGAGVVNLVSALTLLRAGHDVLVCDAAPDPRDGAPWTAYGCTRGGGDGRMFTLTEADSYNSRARTADGASNDLLTRPVSDGGWRLARSLSDTELRWAEEFHQLPPWLADNYNADIFEVNRRAGDGWTRLLASDPDLFETTGYRDVILRLYSDEEYYRWHVARNEKVGAIRTVLTPNQVRDGYPALADACGDGTVAGGLEVVGFTVNIHEFVEKLVGLLEAEGARFRWGTTVSGIAWASPGVADGVVVDGEVLRAPNIVVSPGAYGREVLRGTASHELVQGMLGVWLTVPNVEPMLDHSVKISREGHRAEETNVTLGTGEHGEPVLVCGAGYGWTGADPTNIDGAELDVLFDALEDTILRFFPKAHAAAVRSGLLERSRRHCVRPWTATCLGVFETIPMPDGGALVVTGGHNTGGFAQSPAIAEAVLAALVGGKDPMHTRYHPSRPGLFSR
ncbi:D-amino-acid dehydrogenase [Herbihabitans rhizosphaerae]|uniref:D-amino-acid dehydrogenase n=1 Tax=Herbihabitans rhizosphaerae TaxID=1872711 RepID=A0A4Q7KF91_9PSEU|nr:FAD-dependent oxidoreductase [Herbihabitans rhizosphaerae]RZS33872.1 D-amino-acid dehydrogenase [Herbihabitans rhizosphaerae]